MLLQRRLLVIAGLLALFAQAAKAREWTDSTGKFKVEAELVKVEGDTVFLKKQSDSLLIARSYPVWMDQWKLLFAGT